MITETGIWGQDVADESHIFSYTVARWIGQYLEKDKMLIDIGCGRGTYLQYLKEQGFKKLCGIEGFELNNFEFNNIEIHDLTNEYKAPQKGNVICLEVFEHIPNQYEDMLIDNILNCLDGKLIISVATPGQGGTGHVNCQSNEYVIDKFKGRGLEFLEIETESIRLVPENFVMYFKNTLMIFK